jgi:protein-disulfide isomerase/uncharacterized membrane protein
MTETTKNPSNPEETPPRSARLDPRELALRGLALAGLVASSMLLAEYLGRAGLFCGGAGSGCDAVRLWSQRHLGAVTVPLAGVAYFAGVLALAVFARDAKGRRLLAAAGALGALAGAVFLGLQAFVIHAYCKLCLIVDVASIGGGALAVLLATPREDTREPTRRMNLVTGGAVAAALAIPLSVGLTHAPDVDPGERPPVIEALPAVVQQEQRADAATIVEFVDFECPFCRRQQETLGPVLASYGSRVRVVRKNVPLSFHEHARGAARAACCADEQGRGNRMAEALFRAEDLTPEGCERIARDLGLDMQAYRSCMESRRPDISIDRDHEAARSARVSGLPTIFIGRERFEGLQSDATVRASIDRALRSLPSDAATPRS